MELSSLRIFKTVAEEGSVTLAAARLHRVQSNVSARLTQLEESLGVTLFHRAGRRLLITPEGTRLLEYADRLLRLADEAQMALRGEQEPSGQLRIGSMETTAAARLPRVLGAFHRQYPQVDLVLETGPTDHLVQAVLNHKVDLALVAAPIERPELAQVPVFVEELVLLTDALQGPVQEPADVARRTLLGFRSGCSYRRRLEWWFADAGITPTRIAEFGTFEAIIGCVAAGMGVAMMPREVLKQRSLGRTVQCHDLPPEVAAVETLLVWRRDIPHHPARDAFAASF
ncbi:LysR family transcriptional regulator [Pseudoduganella sp. DS3]|uniref:LysR family transcriptional regulator n=1 Tax=Pseudoduganella guangdongensis TaxID=2692179 RepID=A0A6N9HJN9_9BURK|nr:LysR family transcriptional regulator [Pseudoduganella guangdongensis]MYN03373.1 LysR family transcriptional regulator [Pseudoduganella guangdongensis]